MMGSSAVSSSDWLKGILLSIAASLIGGAAKLAIRNSWLMEHHSADSEDERQSLHNNHTSTDDRDRGSYQTMDATGPTESSSCCHPSLCLQLVWIVLCSHQLIGERPTQRQVLAAALIVLGEVIVAVFGDHTNDVGVSVQEVVSA